jgi:hypothetical protein
MHTTTAAIIPVIVSLYSLVTQNIVVSYGQQGNIFFIFIVVEFHGAKVVAEGMKECSNCVLEPLLPPHPTTAAPLLLFSASLMG